MRKILITVVGLLLAAGVSAAEVGGVKLDDKVTVGGQALVLNGAGVRSRAIFKVYVGSLYVPAKATTLAAVLEKAPRRIQLNILRSLSSDQLTDALSDGLKDSNSAAELAPIKPQVDQLVTTMKAVGDVKEGDVVTIDFVDGATRIALNGTAKGSIAGDGLNRALTKVWIGDNPVQADLKKAMLGG